MDPMLDDIFYGALAVRVGWLDPEALRQALARRPQSTQTSFGELLVELNFITAQQKSELDSQLSAARPTSGQSTSAQSTKPSLATEAFTEHSPRQPQELGSTIAIESSSDSSRFVTLRPLARGGLGKVSVARDVQLQREVALKEILRDHVGSEQVERFLAEARITGSLEHPGIVPVYGLEMGTDGKPRYAMRLIRGRSLHETVQQFHKSKAAQQRSSNEQFRTLLRALIDACNAVAYAHSRGIIHRDIKPANIMLGKFGETLVVDWGLAKVIEAPETRESVSEMPMHDSRPQDSDRTQMGSVLGTASFMSPEQAEGRLDLLSPASDIFSLGATLFAILTGRAPYASDYPDESLRLARLGEVPDPVTLRADTPPMLAAICLKAMARRPADRYPTPLELAADIDRWIAGEPVSAAPEPLSQRLFRWARRHQTTVAATASMLLVGLLASLVANYAITLERNVARNERDTAQEMRQRAESERSRAEGEKRKADLLRESADKLAIQAQDNSRTATAVIEEFVKRIADDKWSSLPNLEADRLAMVQLASSRCQDMLAKDPDNQPLKLAVIQLLVRCSKLYRIMGLNIEASREINLALQLVQQSSALIDDDSQLGTLADTLYSVAEDRVVNEGAEVALSSCAQGLQVARRRLEKAPDSVNARIGLGRALSQHASLNFDTGRPNSALDDALQAAQQFDLVVKASERTSFAILALQCSAHTRVAQALRITGDLVKARSAAEQAVHLGKVALETFPGNNNIIDYAEKSRIELAHLQAAEGKLEAARQALDRALEIYQALEQEHTTVVSYVRMQAEVYIARAQLAERLKDTAGAERDAQAALERLAKVKGEQPIQIGRLPLWLAAESTLLATTTDPHLRSSTQSQLEAHRQQLAQVNSLHPILKQTNSP